MIRKPVKPGYFLRVIALTMVFNSLIAWFINILGSGGDFSENFIFSQCIGICICTLVYRTICILAEKPALYLGLMILAAILVGTAIGGVTAAVIVQVDLTVLWGQGFVLKTLTLGLVFGAIITYIFVSREKMAASKEILHEEKMKRLESERTAAVVHMRQLQAQIEPHFLFNTLSTVLSLMDSAPPQARKMLVAFTDYLRLSLTRIRDSQGTLGQELDMIGAYLDLYQSRMGPRLKYEIVVPEGIKATPFPPMLLQPLVENAVCHGLEPKVEGGEITIRAVLDDLTLRITIADSGVGFDPAGSSGVGIANVKERLASLYGDRARFRLEENSPKGVTATIEVPYDEP